MSKVICDICGTAYQETADSCPICGYSQIFDPEDLKEDNFEEEIILTRNKRGRFAQSLLKKKNQEIYDYDEDEDPDEEDEEEYDEDSYTHSAQGNTAVVVILIVVIMLLLGLAGFLFLRFLLPNMLSKGGSDIPAPVATVATEETTEATTEPTIPCESIVLTGGIAELNRPGQFWLLNVKVMPEDTTDDLTYTSDDESIATVTVDGRITAVSEGETTVYITCGKQQINCPVIVRFVEETEPPTEENPEAEGELSEETEETLKLVALKLKKYDISLSVGYGSQLVLDCDLDPSQVEWSVEHPFIATVDENGFVQAVSYGTTAVIVKYGDQQVQCIVRCK